MTQPTFVQHYQVASFVSTATPQTITGIAVQAGDLVVVKGAGADNCTLGTPTSTGLTFTLKGSTNVATASRSPAWIWSADITTTATISISVARTTGTAIFAFTVSVWRDHNGLGPNVLQANNAATSTAPSGSLTTTAADSAIDAIVADWNAAGTATINTAGGAGAATEDVDYDDVSNWALHCWRHPNAGAAGAKTIGITTPNQRWSFIAVEVLGVTAGVGAAIDPAVITLQGVTPDLVGSGSATAAIDPATVSLQGVTPDLSGSGSATAPVDPATVSLQGVTPTLSGSGSASAAIDPAVLTIEGVTPVLSAGGTTVQIDPAVITLQGVTPSLAGSGSATRAIDPAQLSLQGQTPVLAGSGTASRAVDPATVSLVGQTPSLSGSGSALASIDPAVVTLVGVTPTLSTGPSGEAIPAYRGDDQIQAVYIGDKPVLHRYRGDVQLW